MASRQELIQSLQKDTKARDIQSREEQLMDNLVGAGILEEPREEMLVEVSQKDGARARESMKKSGLGDPKPMPIDVFKSGPSNKNSSGGQSSSGA